MKTMKQLHFTDTDFKKLQNMKEEWKITGKCKDWESFFYNLAILYNHKEVKKK